MRMRTARHRYSFYAGILGGVLVAPGEHQPQEPHGSGRSGRVDRPGRPRAGRGDGSVVDVLSKRDPPRRVVVLVHIVVVVARRRRGRASLQLPVPREVRGPVVAHAVVRAPQRARLAEVEAPPAPVEGVFGRRASRVLF